MLFVQNRLVFGIIKSIIGGIFLAIYKLLGWFHLQLALFVALVGLLAEIAFGSISGDRTSFYVFHAVVCITLVYAVLRTVAAITGIGKEKSDRKSTAQIVGQKDADQPTGEQQQRTDAPDERQPKREIPRYFRVKENPLYIMAEFADRYELYFDNGGQLEYIRTDYKGA